jgi:hypothetical protein
VARRGADHQGAMAHIIVTIILFLEGYFIIIAIRETYKYLYDSIWEIKQKHIIVSGFLREPGETLAARPLPLLHEQYPRGTVAPWVL